MKPITRITFIVSVLAAISMGLFFRTPSIRAAVIPPGEQYRVLDISKYNAVPQLEADLNRFGADGWRVRTSAANGFLILARQP